jgi:hypothetical protein
VIPEFLSARLQVNLAQLEEFELLQQERVYAGLAPKEFAGIDK